MTQKTALIIRHVAYEGAAGFRAPIEAAGYALDRVDVSDAQFSALDLAEPDLLVLMGGPMAVYERDQFPWIAGELARIARRLESGLPTLGVCLGAQMMAAALGAKVCAGPASEVGFHPVDLHPAARKGPLRHIAGVPMLHWHGDTFSLPPDVELLASSQLYPHQAFRRGATILALQFHAEMGLDPRFDTWIAGGGAAIARAGTTAARLRADHDRFGPGAVAAGQRMIAEWLADFA